MAISKNSLKNIIKRIILKEADEYLQDFSSFGDNDNKNSLRNYLTSKNLSKSTIGPSIFKPQSNTGFEVSLFSVNIKNLSPIERSMLKQSLSNGNIQHKVESGVVSFSKKDFNKIKNEVIKLIEDEYEHAQELYKEYFLKNGDNDFATGNVKPNERTKRYEQKLFLELEKVQNIANNLFKNIVNTIDNNYNDRSIDEASVDSSGQLQDFDFFLHSNDTSPLYAPGLKSNVNRFKSFGGGTAIQLNLDMNKEKYLIYAFQRVLKEAKEVGIRLTDDKIMKLPTFTFQTIRKTAKFTFSSKYLNIVIPILERIAKDEKKSSYIELLDRISEENNISLDTY